VEYFWTRLRVIIFDKSRTTPAAVDILAPIIPSISRIPTISGILFNAISTSKSLFANLLRLNAYKPNQTAGKPTNIVSTPPR
jgi:hypothetical protein